MSVTIDTASSQNGTPNGMRTIMVIGEVSGITDNQNATGPSGLFTIKFEAIIPSINGAETGSMNC